MNLKEWNLRPIGAKENEKTFVSSREGPNHFKIM
jgi:hypothetical protein